MKNIEVLSDVYMTSQLRVCTRATRVRGRTGAGRERVCPRVAPAGDSTHGAGQQGQERVYKRGDELKNILSSNVSNAAIRYAGVRQPKGHQVRGKHESRKAFRNDYYPVFKNKTKHVFLIHGWGRAQTR